MPMSVMGFYGAVALWAVLIARSAFKPKQWPLIAGFGLVLLLFLNVRYLIEGVPAGIAFFISLYDFFDNVASPREKFRLLWAPASKTRAPSGEQPMSFIKHGVSRSMTALLMRHPCARTRFMYTSAATPLCSY